MFERSYPPRTPLSALLAGNVAASIGIHLVVLGIIGMGVPERVLEGQTDGIVFLAPIPVQRGEVSVERLTYVDLVGGGNGALAEGVPEVFADGPAALEGQGGTAPEDGTGDEGIASLPEIPEVNVDSVYYPDEVDNPAAYDPRSAAPAYPDSLQRLGIEGSVTARFVVDTNGRAADSTFVIVGATHPRFAQAVVEAMPRMLFRPAELTGVKIRQLVEQTFSFRIPPPERVPGSDSTAGGTRPPSTIPPHMTPAA